MRRSLPVVPQLDPAALTASPVLRTINDITHRMPG
jgi:hypothetical protein